MLNLGIALELTLIYKKIEYYEIEKIQYSQAADNAGLELQKLKRIYKTNHMYPFILHSVYPRFCLFKILYKSLCMRLNIVIFF